MATKIPFIGSGKRKLQDLAETSGVTTINFRHSYKYCFPFFVVRFADALRASVWLQIRVQRMC